MPQVSRAKLNLSEETKKHSSRETPGNRGNPPTTPTKMLGRKSRRNDAWKGTPEGFAHPSKRKGGKLGGGDPEGVSRGEASLDGGPSRRRKLEAKGHGVYP